MKTVADRWQTYAKILSPDAGRTQRQETKRAFYAGVYSALMAGIEMADESGDDDDLGVTLMNNLHEECKAFARDVAAGKE